MHIWKQKNYVTCCYH